MSVIKGSEMQYYEKAIEQFCDLLEQAKHSDLKEPSAMTLATVDATGQPSSRTIILTSVDSQGFVFFTNVQSRKGQQLENNPKASLCVFWQPLMKQVLIEGTVEPVSGQDADAYWATRARDNQLAAWASRQSEPLDDARILTSRLAECRERFEFKQIPRPPHWSGYCLKPNRIEFWTSGWRHLHERVCYERLDDQWSMTLLNP